MLKLLDFFFISFHTVLIFFNLFGWLFRKTRILNLITLVLTGCSWFILGLFYGFGYCPITDWHFSILAKLGEENLPASYIEYLVERFFPVNLNSQTVDRITALLFFLALIASIIVNIIDFRSRERVYHE
jgi:hypothetical protein